MDGGSEAFGLAPPRTCDENVRHCTFYSKREEQAIVQLFN